MTAATSTLSRFHADRSPPVFPVAAAATEGYTKLRRRPGASIPELPVGLALTLVWAFMNEVTQILTAMAGGDRLAGSQLLPLVYDELRKLAAQRLAQEKPGQTLQATALVHEAYLRLVGEDQGQQFDGRGHFFAACAEAMRRILVDHARAKSADKRGGRWKRVELGDWHNVAQPPEQVMALNEAIDRLAALAPEKAQLVTLRYFGGLSLPEAADALGVSLRTAERWWHFARSWLYAALLDDNE
jgi:RNA polymerase sigma factor (TIGR02999 family)